MKGKGEKENENFLHGMILMTENITNRRNLCRFIISSCKRALEAKEVARCRRRTIDFRVNLEEGFIHVVSDETTDGIGEGVLGVEGFVCEVGDLGAGHARLVELEDLAAVVHLGEVSRNWRRVKGPLSTMTLSQQVKPGGTGVTSAISMSSQTF